MSDAIERGEDAPTTDHTGARSRRIEVITGRERRRRWAVEQKRKIVAESLEAGASPSVVARRHGIGTGLLYTWRQQVLQGELGGAVKRPVPDFARVDVMAVPPRLETSAPTRPEAEAAAALPRHEDAPLPAHPDGRIEIVLSDGVVVRVDTGVNEGALRRVLAALAVR